VGRLKPVVVATVERLSPSLFGRLTIEFCSVFALNDRMPLDVVHCRYRYQRHISSAQWKRPRENTPETDYHFYALGLTASIILLPG
jgi:hypothetical protein